MIGRVKKPRKGGAANSGAGDQRIAALEADVRRLHAQVEEMRTMAQRFIAGQVQAPGGSHATP